MYLYRAWGYTSNKQEGEWKVDDEILSESTAICEYLEEEYPDKALLPDNPKERFEARRLVSWFDDKFHNEVTSKLLYERINKKIMGQGFPDSKNIKEGSIKSNLILKFDNLSTLVFSISFRPNSSAVGVFSYFSKLL